MSRFAPLSWLRLKGLASAYRYRGPRSDHFDGERFFNHPPLPERSREDFKRWRQERKNHLPRWHWQPGLEPPCRPVAEAGEDEIRVTLVNHSTFLIQLPGLNLLTDPIWSERASPFTFAGPKRFHPPGVALEALPRIDAVLLSHNHYDHCDVWTLRQLGRRFPEMRLFTGLGNRRLCRDAGVRVVEELDWWQQAELGGRRLTFVPARHWGARSLWDRRCALWGGFVLETSLGKIYFAGDTGFGDDFAKLRQRFGPMAVSLLPIGAFRPQWFMRDFHMGPDEALEAHRQLGSQRSLACHFGCFSLADDGQFEPQQRLEAAREARGIDSEAFIVPTPGETLRYSRRCLSGEPELAL